MSKINLPLGWSEARIADIAIKGEQRKPVADEQFVYVDIGSINRDLKRIDSPQQLLGQDAPSRARKVINSGDVLVSLTRPNLNAVALISEEYDNQIASTGFEVIKPILVGSRYIFALTRTKHFIEQISGVVQGALYPAAKASDVQAYIIPLAPLAEQKIIADKLDTLLAQVDTTKARLERIPDIIERFRQSVLAAAVSGKLTREWRIQNQLTNETKHLTLGDVANVSTGVTPLKKEASYYVGGTIPWLTSSVTGLAKVTNAENFITEKALNECRLKLYKPGTLLIAMYGEGKTRGQVTELGIEAIINQACAAIDVNQKIASNKFIKICIETNYEQTRMMAEGGNQPNLNLSKVRNIPISLPSMQEQYEIVRIVKELCSFSSSVQEKASQAIERVNKLTQSILAKAFRGELTDQWRAENLELITGENSAEALLERIKAERELLKQQSKPKRKTKPRAAVKRSNKMKQRRDEDVWQKAYLTGLIKNNGASIKTEELFAQSQLEVSDFYKQLAWEVSQGLVKSLANNETLEVI
jgi:type I restriction enzyme S subunit